MPQNIVFIGLGVMGLSMAKNLVNAVYKVTGCNRSDEAGNELAAAGLIAGQAASAGLARCALGLVPFHCLHPMLKETALW